LKTSFVGFLPIKSHGRQQLAFIDPPAAGHTAGVAVEHFCEAKKL
jgi:hypothetical protein